MMHHYLQRGWRFRDFVGLSLLEKQFLLASMALHIEEETEKFKALAGGS
jgi:hypothetical protein